MTEPLTALALWRDGSEHAGTAGRDLANAGALAVSRLDRRMHLGCRRPAGGEPGRGRRAAIAAQIARSASKRCSATRPTGRATIPRAPPRVLVWNPAPRRRGGVVVADLTWFRRDMLVGPPGARAPRKARAPGEVALGRPRRPSGPATWPHGAHERLDAPRHYPDQDEVEVTRLALDAAAGRPGIRPRLAGPQPETRARPRGRPDVEQWTRSGHRGARRHGDSGRPPHGGPLRRAASAGILGGRRGYLQLRRRRGRTVLRHRARRGLRVATGRWSPRWKCARARAAQWRGGSSCRAHPPRRQPRTPLHPGAQQPRPQSPAPGSHSGSGIRSSGSRGRTVRPGVRRRTVVEPGR